VEPDDGMEEEGPYLAWLPPDDRLWRHPSEGAGPSQPPGTESTESDDEGKNDGGGGGTHSMPSQLAGWARRPAARIWAIAVVAAIVGAVAATGVGMVTGVFEQQTVVVRSVTPTAPTVTLASATSNGVDWSGVDDAVAPSVVGIQVTTASGPATGSGLLFEPGEGYNSYVMTDSSLVAGASGITVSLVGGQQYRGKVIGSDPMSGLALIAVAIPYQYQNFPEMGSVAELRLANPVLAVGARANAPASVFSGPVTAEDREVDVTGGSTMENLIAVSGSSPLPSTEAGGPLVGQDGRIVGITVSLDPTNSSDQGLIFAVPVDVAVHVAQQMLAGSRVTHPWLGIVDADDVTSAVANQYSVSGAAEVGAVSPGSPAGRMGLRPSDIITSVNGTLVSSSGTLTQILFAQGVPGRPLTIRYIHNGKWVEGVVEVTNQPPGD
jgi:putative serine protease PepD